MQPAAKSPTQATSPSQAKSPTQVGRLDRHVRSQLGETLRAMFDDIVRQGVPERFVMLLEQIDNIPIREVVPGIATAKKAPRE